MINRRAMRGTEFIKLKNNILYLSWYSKIKKKFIYYLFIICNICIVKKREPPL